MRIGALTAAEVMLTTRPNLRRIMPSTVARIRKMGVSMLAFSAAIHSSSPQSRKSPGGGPPALLTRMSGSGQAARTASRPPTVVMSQATVVTATSVWRRISSAVAASGPGVRAQIVRSTPARASDRAEARPSPLLAAQTNALRPAIPRSMVSPPPSLRLPPSRPSPGGPMVRRYCASTRGPWRRSPRRSAAPPRTCAPSGRG